MQDRDLKEVSTGIRLILEEIRDLRWEGVEDRKQAAEDRKEAAENRKEAAEDRRAFREAFDRYSAEAASREKDLRKALVVIGNVGREFSNRLKGIQKGQAEQTQLLKEIRTAVRVRGNGNGRNGHSR